MHILLTSQIFPPERHPTGVLVKELAQELAANGWRTTVATGFPNHPHGRLYPGYEKKLVSTETVNGFQVVRAWYFTYAGSSMFLRSLAMASQAAAFLLAALKSSPPQVVIAGPPPIFGPLVFSLIAEHYGAKLVPFIHDTYPDIVVGSFL